MYQDKKKPLLRRGFSGLFSPLFHFVQNSPPKTATKHPSQRLCRIVIFFKKTRKALKIVYFFKKVCEKKAFWHTAPYGGS